MVPEGLLPDDVFAVADQALAHPDVTTLSVWAGPGREEHFNGPISRAMLLEQLDWAQAASGLRLFQVMARPGGGGYLHLRVVPADPALIGEEIPFRIRSARLVQVIQHLQRIPGTRPGLSLPPVYNDSYLFLQPDPSGRWQLAVFPVEVRAVERAVAQLRPAAGLESGVDFPNWPILEDIQPGEFDLLDRRQDSSAALAAVPSSSVRTGDLLVFGPGMEDLALLVNRMAPQDEKVAVTTGLEEERLLQQAGFTGITLRADLLGGVEAGLEAAAALYPEMTPRFYLADQRDRLLGWLGDLLGRYRIPESLLSVNQARQILQALERFRSA